MKGQEGGGVQGELFKSRVAPVPLEMNEGLSCSLLVLQLLTGQDGK